MTEKLILGTVQMGLSYGVNNRYGKIPLQDSLSILNKAYEVGISTLDTAEVYGDSHKIIGIHHKKNPRKIFKVITKIPSSTNLKSNLESKIENYLLELNVHHIDTLMYHSFELYKTDCLIRKQLLELRKNGYYLNLGVSIYTNQELEYLIYDEEIKVIQLPFNIFDNISKRGKLLEKAKTNGKIIHTRSTFLQGIFFKNPEDVHPVVSHLRRELMNLHVQADQFNLSIADIALGYSLAQKNIDQVLIGVDSIAHLQENIKASLNTIPIELIHNLDSISIDNENLLNPSLWNQ